MPLNVIFTHCRSQKCAKGGINFLVWIGSYKNIFTILMASQGEGPIRQDARIPFRGSACWFKLYWTSITTITIFLGDLKHELKNLVKFQCIIEDETTYIHFNFTIKTKKADNGGPFFAEVSRIQQTKAWVVNCCCKIGPNDNGICLGCTNNESTIKHPNNTAYVGGHEDVFLPFGGDPLSDSEDEDEEALKDRLRIMFENPG